MNGYAGVVFPTVLLLYFSQPYFMAAMPIHVTHFMSIGDINWNHVNPTNIKMNKE